MRLTTFVLSCFLAYLPHVHGKTVVDRGACERAVDNYMREQLNVEDYSVRLSFSRNDEGRVQSAKATVKPQACDGHVVLFLGSGDCRGGNNITGTCEMGGCKGLSKAK